MTTRLVWRITLIPAAFVAAGCYTYTPVGEPRPGVGSRISAELTGAGADSLARAIGPGAQAVRGEVLAQSETELLLSVVSVTGRGGEEVFWNGEAVQLPTVTVARLERRKFSLGRSLVLAGAAVGAAFLSWEAFRGERQGAGVSGPQGNLPAK